MKINKVEVTRISALEINKPIHALVKNTDLVITKHKSGISILYGRCLHRGALMSDGHVEGHNLICGVHGWDYRVDSGISEYNNNEVLQKFTSKIINDDLFRRQPQSPFHPPSW